MDETTPLLPSTTSEILDDDRRILDHVSHKDIVDFDPNGDPENPQDWAASYKWGIVALLAIQAFAVTFTCISVVPVAKTIVDDLLASNPDTSPPQDDTAASSAAVLLVTIWELGEALGALFIAPLSELYGRAPVMNIGNLLFVACTAAGALSRSVTLLIVARALTGVAVVTNVLNPAIIGDIFPPEQRGAAMSLVQLSPLLGGAIGPAIAGAVSQSVGWRANLWVSTVLAGGCEIVFLVLFRETYKVPILRRKAARLREETGNPDLRTEFDVVRWKHDGGVGADGKHARANSNWTLVAEAVLRPFVVLKSSFVLQIMSLYSGILFSYFYTMSTSFPRLLQDVYGFTPAQTGLSFITFSESAFFFFTCSRLSLLYTDCKIIRRGLPRQRMLLQRLPRQDLHPLARQAPRRRAARVSAPARHRRRLPLPRLDPAVRLVGPAPAAARRPLALGRPPGRLPAAGVPAHDGLRGGRVRHLLGVVGDGRHLHAVRHGHLHAARRAAPLGPARCRVGVYDFRGGECGDGADSRLGVSVRPQMEAVFQVHKGLKALF